MENISVKYGRHTTGEKEMKKYVIFAALTAMLFIQTNAVSAKEVYIPRSVSGDRGSYYLVEMSKKNNVVRALSKRVGVSAIDYSLVEINCSTMMMRGLGESESVPPVAAEKPTKWFSLVPGSSKSDLANFVCRKLQ